MAIYRIIRIKRTRYYAYSAQVKYRFWPFWVEIDWSSNLDTARSYIKHHMTRDEVVEMIFPPNHGGQ